MSLPATLPLARKLPPSHVDSAVAVSMALRPHQVAQLWSELQKKEAAGYAFQRSQIDHDDGPTLPDPLNPDERTLYQVLTKRLIVESHIVSVIQSESEQ